MITPVEFRRRLHASPELSFEEHETSRFIARCLDEAAIEWRPIAGTGILARIEGRGDTRRTVVLRADIDALPIDEQCDAPWRSQRRGVMHACGHDMHAAMLYGAALSLAAQRDFCGTVLCLFQPGEECNPGGAAKVLAEKPFDGCDIAAVVGQHVEAGMPAGEIGLCPGLFMASNDELRFRVEGRGGHAAMRERLHDPVAAAARLITRLLALNAADATVSIGRVEAAGATNVIPDDVYMEGTMRTFDEDLRQRIYDDIGRACRDVSEQYGVHIAPNIDRGYPSVVNDERLTALAARVATQQGVVVHSLARRTTAEDFGFYTRLYPSLFYRIGVGVDSGGTHTPTFNPDENAIGKGAEFMRALALEILENKWQNTEKRKKR